MACEAYFYKLELPSLSHNHCLGKTGLKKIAQERKQEQRKAFRVIEKSDFDSSQFNVRKH